MGQVAGVKRDLWINRKAWVGISSVDLQGGASPPVRLDGEVPTAAQEGAEGLGQLGRTPKASSLVISDHCSTLMIPRTCWTSPPHSLTPAKLHPPLDTSHPAQLPVTAGLPHSLSGALRVQVLGRRVQARHLAPQAGLHIAMPAWPKHPPPLLPILNPLLHLSHTLLAPPIQPLTATTLLATPAPLLWCHRDPQTAAGLVTTLARPTLSVQWVILAIKPQPSGATLDIQVQVIPLQCGGTQQDRRHLEEDTCLWPKVAPSAPPP